MMLSVRPHGRESAQVPRMMLSESPGGVAVEIIRRPIVLGIKTDVAQRIWEARAGAIYGC